MLTYLVRRLIGAVILLFIVSAVVFSIFFLVPRLAGATSDDLASRYVGKSAGAPKKATRASRKAARCVPPIVVCWPFTKDQYSSP